MGSQATGGAVVELAVASGLTTAGHLRPLSAHPLAGVLTSMPGAGFRTAIKILTIVGDGSAFPTAGHLAAYAGLAPVTRRSRSSLKGETRSQRGNRALKSALFLSAFASLADPVSRAYYDRKRAAGKRHNAALICLARRRTDVIFAMLRDRKRYAPPTTAPPIPEPLGGLTAAIETPLPPHRPIVVQSAITALPEPRQLPCKSQSATGPAAGAREP